MIWAKKIVNTISKSLGRRLSKQVDPIEKVPEITPPNSIATYAEMFHQDPIVGGTVLRLINTLGRAKPTFYGDKRVAELVKPHLHLLVRSMATSLVYGFYVGELVWKSPSNFKVFMIPQISVQEINHDEGEIVQANNPEPIPITKCIYFTFSLDTTSPYGDSILRHVYKPFYYKTIVEAVEGVSIERDLGGIPKLQAPEGFDFSAADESSPNYNPQVAATLDWAIDLVSNVRKDEAHGIVLPYGWTFELVGNRSEFSSQTSEVIRRYNSEITAGILESFVMASTTSREAVGVMLEDFMLACDSYLMMFASVLNEQFLSKVSLYNGLDEAYIEFDSVRIFSLAELASYIARLVDKQVITPTTELEEALLRVASLPRKEE